MSPRTVAVLVVASCCAGAGCGAGTSSVEQKIQRHLRSWDTYREEWAAKADVVVLATYRRGSYPCISLSEGILDMPSRSTFTIKEVLKGRVGRPDLDANLAGLDSKRFPRDFVSGRKYLVFLKPGTESRAILDDPKEFFNFRTQMPAEELVAVIDVSKSKTEVESEKVQAHRSGRHGDFTFTPEKWRALREAKTSDIAAHKPFLPFITNVVLRDAATISHVRSYLGEPDHRYMNADGTCYRYELNMAAPRPLGTVVGEIELYFDPDGKLRGYSVKYYKHMEPPPESKIESDRCLTPLDPREREELGLTEIDR